MREKQYNDKYRRQSKIDIIKNFNVCVEEDMDGRAYISPIKTVQNSRAMKKKFFSEERRGDSSSEQI